MTNKKPKSGFHPRNPHRFNYDFPALIESSPELKSFIQKNPRGQDTIEFSNPVAVKALNRALLFHFYALKQWDMPDDYLCPPIPGRADYIHYMADLLAEAQGNHIPEGSHIRVLDIGTGASCIYPIIGHKSYGWSFVASETDRKAVKSSRAIIQENNFSESIECRKQNNKDHIFKGIFPFSEHFDITICNPPFYNSVEAAHKANQRKTKNLGLPAQKNFGGKSHEVWYPGGELAFVNKMILESQDYRNHCLWFSTLISNKDHVKVLNRTLKKVKVEQIKTIPMAQGQKSSRILAWTFRTPERVQLWVKQHWK